MDNYKKDIDKFIREIETKNIYRNDVEIGVLSQSVINKLLNKNIQIESEKVFLSIQKYNHLMRDFKKELGKAISKDTVLEIYNIINNPDVIKFDNKNKNILFFSKIDDKKTIKVVIQPNYKTGKSFKNYVLTAGIVFNMNIKNKFYEDIVVDG